MSRFPKIVATSFTRPSNPARARGLRRARSNQSSRIVDRCKESKYAVCRPMTEDKMNLLAAILR